MSVCCVSVCCVSVSECICCVGVSVCLHVHVQCACARYYSYYACFTAPALRTRYTRAPQRYLISHCNYFILNP